MLVNASKWKLTANSSLTNPLYFPKHHMWMVIEGMNGY